VIASSLAVVNAPIDWTRSGAIYFV